MKARDLLDEYRVTYKEASQHHHVTQGFIGLDCPFCSPYSGRYRLGWNLEKNYVTCWSCGSHSLFDTLLLLTSESPHKIKELLKGVQSQREFKQDLRGKLVLPDGVGELLPVHKRYLKSRGLDPEEVKELWHVQGIALGTLLSWRILIPVMSACTTSGSSGWMTSCFSWTTRALSDTTRRYVSASPSEEVLPLKSLLLGQHYVGHCIAVTEGPFDAMKIGPGAVCTFGASFTQAQVLKIAKYPVRVICLDSDATGRRQARKLCSLLESFPGTTYNVTLSSGSDPCSAATHELVTLRSFLK